MCIERILISAVVGGLVWLVPLKATPPEGAVLVPAGPSIPDGPSVADGARLLSSGLELGDGQHALAKAESYSPAESAPGQAGKQLPSTARLAHLSERSKPVAHTVREIEGWTIRIDDRLLAPPADALGERALRFLESKLSDIRAVEVVDDPAQGLPDGVALRLDAPVDYQVIQRRTAGEGRVRVSGWAPAGTDTVEVQILGDWFPAELNKVGGMFQADLTVPAGGWYVCRARAIGSGRVLATAQVPHVGVGEVFVVAGQSNSANHGEERLEPETGLVTTLDGKRWRPASDPQPGASGNGGSFMPPFGDAMARGFKVPIGLVACGIGATSVREWLPKGVTFPNPPTLVSRVQQLPDGAWQSDGAAFASLTARMQQLGPRGFRAVLWHQGESDANQEDPACTLPGELYRQYLTRVIEDSRLTLSWEVPWFVAQVSYHVPGDEASPDIRAAQRSLWATGIALEGPDTDALKGEFREREGRGVHFSGKGLREHAARWVDKVAPWLAGQLAPGPKRERWKGPHSR